MTPTSAVQQGGPGYCSPKIFVASGPPNIANDQTTGVDPGDLFIDQTNNVGYVCISAATGAAVWNLTPPSTGLIAVGTNQATALALAGGTSNITTAAASTGVALPPATLGARARIYNNGANAIKVYGTAGRTDTIDGTAGATGVTLSSGKRCDYECVLAGVWLSAQLGVVSA